MNNIEKNIEKQIQQTYFWSSFFKLYMLSLLSL